MKLPLHLLSAVFMSGLLHAQGPLTPPVGTPTAGMRSLDQIEPRIPISPATTPPNGAATDAITAPGSYYLTSPVAAAGKACAIDISTAGDVTLDLAGQTISGGSTATLRCSGSVRLRLVNGTIDAESAPNAVLASGDLTASSVRIRRSGQALVAVGGTLDLKNCQLEIAPSGVTAPSASTSIESCSFDQISGTSVTLSGDGSSLRGCNFTRCGPPANGSGIVNLRGLAQQVAGNHFGPLPGPAIHATTQGHEIRGNYFYLLNDAPALSASGPRTAFRDNTYYCPGFLSGRSGGMDGGGNVSLAANSTPTAVITGPSTADMFAPINLSGTASSDADGDVPLTYTWTIVQSPSAGAALTINGAAAALPGSVATPITPGIYRFRLVVTDSLGAASGPTELQVIVPDTQTPTAVLDQVTANATAGAACQITGIRSSDPAPGSVTQYSFTLTAKPSGSSFTLNSPVTQGTPVFSFTPDMAGNFTWKLIVFDNAGNPSAATFLTVVAAAAQVPTAVLDQVTASPVAGSACQLKGDRSSDVAPGSVVQFAFTLAARPSGSAVPLATTTQASSAFSFTPDRGGNYSWQLVVTDNSGNNSAPVFLAVIVSGGAVPTAVLDLVTSPAHINLTCQMTGNRSTDVAPGSVVQYSFTLVSRPSGSTIPTNIPNNQSTPTFNFTPDKTGVFQWQLIVTDNNGNPSSAAVLAINVST